MLKSIRFDLMVALPALVVASLLGAFSVAHAQVDVNVGGSADTSVSGDAPVSDDENSDGSAGVTGNADVDASIDADSESAGDSDEGGMDAGINAALELDQDAAASISVTAEDGTSMTAADVSTDEDLRVYAAAALQQDSHIEGVRASSDGVSVTYRVPARFLGFIPGSLAAQARVAGNGTVSIDYPWYRIFFALDDTDAEARLAAEVEALTAGNTSGTISASLGAQLIDRMSAALAASATASAE